MGHVDPGALLHICVMTLLPGPIARQGAGMSLLSTRTSCRRLARCDRHITLSGRTSPVPAVSSLSVINRVCLTGANHRLEQTRGVRLHQRRLATPWSVVRGGSSGSHPRVHRQLHLSGAAY